MFRAVLITLCLCLQTVLCAVEAPEAISALHGDPEGLIAGCVDAVSGSFVHRAEDTFPYPYNSLSLTRTYCGYTNNWYFLPHLILIETKVSSTETVYSLQDKSGNPLIFKGKNQPPDCRGAANTTRGHIGGATALKNYVLSDAPLGLQLSAGDNTIRFYQETSNFDLGLLAKSAFQLSSRSSNKYYRLTKELLPNHNVLLYDYNNQGYLTSITLQDTKSITLGTMTFTYASNQVTAAINGKVCVTYAFKDDLLRSVTSASKPKVSYFYTSVWNTLQLSRIEIEKEPVLALEFSIWRQVTSIAKNSKPLITSITYHSGCTTVLDAQDQKTRYFHKNNLLTTIETYDGSQLYSTEKWVWGGHDSSEIQARLFYDGSNILRKALRFYYDTKGNIVNQLTLGNCSNATPIVLDSSGIPEVKNCYEASFVFNDKNLLTEIHSISGGITTCKYNTENLLIEKATTEKINRAQGTETYSYDQTGQIIVKKVEQNNKVPQETRFIHAFTYGTPGQETVEEYAGSKLQKKTVVSLDERGNPTVSKLYDANTVYVSEHKFTYDAHNNLTQKIDPIGRTMQYRYDAWDRLIEAQESASQSVTSYQYQNDNLTRTTQKYRDGTQDVEEFEYDTLGNTIASKDSYGNVTKYTYDFLSRLLSVTYPTVYDEYQKPQNPQETMAYDLFDNVISKTNCKGEITKTTYDVHGNPVCVEYPDGTSEQFKIGPDHSFVSKTNRDKSVEIQYFDVLGERTNSEIRTFSADGKEKLLFKGKYTRTEGIVRQEVTDDKSNKRDVYSYIYDEAGRINRRQKLRVSWNFLQSCYEDHIENEECTYYDSLGRPWCVEHCTSRYAQYYEKCTYDILGRMVSSYIEQNNGNINNKRTFTYDLLDNPTEADADGKSVVTQYDAKNRPETITDKKGNITRFQYGMITNALGQKVLQVKRILPSKTQLIITYDALDREVLIESCDMAGKVLLKRAMFYDLEDHLAATQEHILDIPYKKNSSSITRWEWGSDGQLKTLYEAAGSAYERITRYTYTTSGKISRLQLPSGSAYEYLYDIHGLCTSVVFHANNQAPKTLITYVYNEKQQLIEALTASGIKTNFEYLTSGDICKEITSGPFGSYFTSYGKDLWGRLKECRFSNDVRFAYEFDGTNLARISYDYYGASETLYFKTDQEGRIYSEADYYNTNCTRSYDVTGDLNSLSSPYDTQCIVDRDAEGNPLTIRHNTVDNFFSYDSIGRLTAETAPFPLTYAYDSFGNMTKKESAGKKFAYDYNPLNELVSRRNYETDEVLQYTYDLNGNLIKIKDRESGQEMSLSYNELNQMIVATNFNGETINYMYDAFGRRVVAGDKLLAYVGINNIAALDKNLKVTELKIPHELSSKEAVGAAIIVQGQQIYLPILDLRGNIIALVDRKSKQVVERYSLSAFGEEVITDAHGNICTTPPSGNPWRYCGLRHDPVTSFVAFPFRDYDPATHRFTTKDPVGHDDGGNLYAYVWNNPNSYFDTSGLKGYRGACICHGQECAYYTDGVCGHNGGVWHELPDDVPEKNGYVIDPPSTSNGQVTSKKSAPPSRAMTQLNKSKYSKLSTYGNFGAHLVASALDTFDHSGLHSLPGKPIEGQLNFVNGANNPIEDALRNAFYFRELADKSDTYLIYNGSSGLIIDLVECATNLAGGYTNPAVVLAIHVTNFFDTHPDPNLACLVGGHSQGCMVTLNMLNLLPEDYQHRVLVAAVAPEAYIPKGKCRDVVHLTNNADVVPWLHATGWLRAKKEKTIIEVSNQKKLRNVHGFQNEIYRQELKKIIDAYLKNPRRQSWSDD